MGMKKIIMMIVACTVSNLFAQELQNPGFEQLNGTVPAGWNIYYKNAKRNLIDKVEATTDALNGKYAVKLITQPEEDNSLASLELAQYVQPVSANAKYRFEFSGKNDGQGYVFGRWTFYDKDNKEIKVAKYWTGINIKNDGDWKTVAEIIETPAGTVKMAIVISFKSPGGGGKAIVDNVLFVPQSKTADDAYLQSIWGGAAEKQTTEMQQPIQQPVQQATSNLFRGDTSFELDPHGGYSIVVSTYSSIVKTLDSNTAAIGKSSLKVIVGSSSDSLWSAPVRLSGPGKYTLSLYAKAQNDKEPLTLRLLGLEGEKALSVNLSKEWARYVFTQDLKGKGLYRMRLDLRTGPVWIDGVQLEKGAAATPYAPSAKLYSAIAMNAENEGIFYKDEPVDVEFGMIGDNGAGTVDVEMSIAGIDGLNIMRDKKSVTPDAGGLWKFKTGAVLPAGYYGAKIKLMQNVKVIDETSRFFAVVPRPEPQVLQPGMMPFCGIDSLSVLEGCKRIGVRRLEVYFLWKMMMPDGNIIWTPEINHLQYFKARGFDIKALIQVTPPEWTIDPVELKESKTSAIFMLPKREQVKNYEKFVNEAVTRFGQYIDVFEFGGEDNARIGQSPYYKQKYSQYVNGGFVFGPVVDRLAELYETGVNQTHLHAPGKPVGIVRPTMVVPNRDCAFSAAIVARMPDKFELFPMDPYSGHRIVCDDPSMMEIPEDYLPEIYTKGIAMLQKQGRGQKIYNSEIGYDFALDTPPDSRTARKVAAMLSRIYLVSRFFPVEGVDYFKGWTGYSNDGTEHYSIWDVYGSPYPAAAAYSNVAQVVENVLDKKIIARDVVWSVIFKKPAGADAAVWMPRGSGSLKIELEKDMLAFNMLGAEIKTADGRIKIGEEPVFIRSRNASAWDSLQKKLNADAFGIIPVEIGAVRKSNDAMEVDIYNSLLRPVKGAAVISVNGKPAARESIVIGQKGKKVLSIPAALTLDGRETVRVEFTEDSLSQEPVVAEFTLDTARIAMTKVPVVIDGRLDKWKNQAPNYVRNEFKYMFPKDNPTWTGPDDLSAKVWYAWDRNNLYVAAEVKDNAYSNNAKTASGIWNGDCLQLGFDVSDCALKVTDKARKTGSAVDLNMGMAIVGGKPVLHVWNGLFGAAEQIRYAIVRNEQTKLTAYEAAIPWSALGVKAPENKTVGINFVVFDDDNGLGQRQWLELCGGMAGMVDPAKFQRVIFFAGNN